MICHENVRSTVLNSRPAIESPSGKAELGHAMQELAFACRLIDKFNEPTRLDKATQ